MVVTRAWRHLWAPCLSLLLAGCIDSEIASPPQFLNDEATVTFDVNIDKVSGNFNEQALAELLKSPNVVVEGQYLPSSNIWLVNSDIETRWHGLSPIPTLALAPRMKLVRLHAGEYQIANPTHLRFGFKRELSSYYVLHGIRVTLPDSSPILNWPAEPFDLQVNLVSPPTGYTTEPLPPFLRQQVPFVFSPTRYAASGSVSVSNAYVAVEGGNILADATSPTAQAAMAGSRYAGYQAHMDEQKYLDELSNRVILDASEVFRRRAAAQQPDSATSGACDCAPSPEEDKATLDEYNAWLAKYRAAQNFPPVELVLTNYPDAPPKEKALADRHTHAKVEGHLLDYFTAEVRHAEFDYARHCLPYSEYKLFFVDRRMVDYWRKEVVCTSSDEKQTTTTHAKWDDQGRHVYLYEKCEDCEVPQDAVTQQDNAAWQRIESFGVFIARDVLTTPDVTGMYKDKAN